MRFFPFFLCLLTTFLSLNSSEVEVDFPLLEEATLFENQPPQNGEELYIDLIKKVVANTIYEDIEIVGRIDITRPYSLIKREFGLDHPALAHTMIGIKRLNNVHYCVKKALENQIEGDLIETGVWRGGTCILMKAILKAYNDSTRKVWVADSFEGLPPPNEEKYPEDQGLYLCCIPYLAVSVEEVQENFKKYHLLDDQVVFLKGLFKDTLPQAPIEKIAVLRLDGDLYESTMDTLNNLYHKVSQGGYVIIDDYGAIYACRKAVFDFRKTHGIEDPMYSIDTTGVFWQKS